MKVLHQKINICGFNILVLQEYMGLADPCVGYRSVIMTRCAFPCNLDRELHPGLTLNESCKILGVSMSRTCGRYDKFLGMRVIEERTSFDGLSSEASMVAILSLASELRTLKLLLEKRKCLNDINMEAFDSNVDIAIESLLTTISK